MSGRKGLIDKNFVTKTFDYIRQYIKPAAVITGLLGFVYLHNGCETNSWTYKQIIEYNNKNKTEQQKKIEKQKITEADYKELFKDAKTRADSIAIYNKFDALRDNIKLKQVSSEDMEEAVKQSKLERKL